MRIIKYNRCQLPKNILDGFAPEIISGEGENYIVLHDENNVIGIIEYTIRDFCWWSGIEIKKEYQRRGYGKALVRSFIDEIKREGIDLIAGDVLIESKYKIDKILENMKKEGVIKDYNHNDPFGDYWASKREPLHIYLK